MRKLCKRALSLLLAVLMVVNQAPLPAAAATDGNDWTDYAVEVTPNTYGVYEISTAAELAWLAKGINDASITQYTYDDDWNLNYKTFRLTADIDLSAHQWVPIGDTYNRKFSAIFDGAGYTVTGMCVGTEDEPYGGGYYAGLFGYFAGTVTDLKITDAAVYATRPSGGSGTYAGLLAGYVNGYSCAISNCETKGQVYTTGTTYTNWQYGAAGGLVGELGRGTIDACRTDVTLGLLDTEDTTSWSLGGIAANAGVNETASITNCVAVMKASVPEEKKTVNYSIAGLVVNGSNGTVSNCIARADYGYTVDGSYTVSGTNICDIKTNLAKSKYENYEYVGKEDADPVYQYYDGEGTATDMTAESMQDAAFVETLNTAAEGIDGALTWSLDAEQNGGFPTLAGAGLHNFYAVNFISVGETYRTQRVREGNKVSGVAVPERAGYTFLYWYADDEETAYDFAASVTADLTLTAKWEAHVHTVRFDSVGGTYVYPQTVPTDQTAELPAEPVKKGATFVGWYTDSNYENEWNFSTPITGDTTLYAKWSGASDLAITGRITDAASGEGLQGASVALDNGMNAICDEFGYYRITNVPEGTYKISVIATGYDAVTESGFVLSGISASFDAALTSKNESGAQTANVYATVSCVYSGIMLSNVTIKAVGAGDLGTYTLTTDENGFALFSGLPTGSYTFYINQSGQPGWESYTSEAQTLSGDYNLNCALKPNYQSLTVHVKAGYDPVTEQADVLIEGATVRLVGVDPKDESRELVHLEVKTDENGTATEEKLVPITWKISSSEFAYTETETTIYSNGAGKLSKSDVTLTLPFEESSLTVDLTSVYEDPDIFKASSEGSPATLKVELAGVTGTMAEGIIREASLDENGKAIFTKLMPGSYRMTASGAAKRYVSITSGDGKEIYGQSQGKKYFEVDFDGRGTANVGLGQKATAQLQVTPAPVSFSGTLYKSDMNADGSISTTPLANTKMTIKPSEYYNMTGAAADGMEIETDANGHYAVSLWPGLYGVEVDSAYAANYTGGSIVYYQGMTAEWSKGEEDYYSGYSCGWPSAYKWSGSNASAQAWITGKYGVGQDVGGMNLSSGTVVADLKLAEKKISFTYNKPNVNPAALMRMIESVDKEEKEDAFMLGGSYSHNDPFYYDKHWEHSYSIVDYHPETRGATVTVRGAISREYDMTGKSFPLVLNDLGPGDYTFSYTMDPVLCAHLTATRTEKKFSFFNFPAAGKLPTNFPEDYAENENPWPLDAVRDDGVIINAKEDQRIISDFYDGDGTNGEINFKFYNLNKYKRMNSGLSDAPQKPEGYTDTGDETYDSGTWLGVALSQIQKIKDDQGADLHWRELEITETESTDFPGAVTRTEKPLGAKDAWEGIYDDTNMPIEKDYYEIDETNYGSQIDGDYNRKDGTSRKYLYGSKVHKPAEATYPEKPVYPEAPDSSDKKYWKTVTKTETYTGDDGKEHIRTYQVEEFQTDAYNADYEAWQAECDRIQNEYNDAVDAFYTALENAKAQYKEDYAAWYKAEYTDKGFPKQGGALYYCPEDAGDDKYREHWDENYVSMESYCLYYNERTFLVGWSTELEPGKIFYPYQSKWQRSSNTALPDGKVTLYFCAPKGASEYFLKNLMYIRNQENYKDLFESDLWFSVQVPESGVLNCDINFADPSQSKNVTILSQKDAENLLNPRTIKVQAIEENKPENTVDVTATITIDESTFSSAVAAGYAEQTCSSWVDSAAVTSDEWEYTGSSVTSIFDASGKTETFLVPVKRKQYIYQVTVKDDAGNPVKGAVLKFAGKDRGVAGDLRTDADGKAQYGYENTSWNGEKYVSGGLTLQAYEVSVSASGYGAQKFEIAKGDFPGSLTKTITLTRQPQPTFLEDNVSMDRKGAFIPGVNFVGGSTNQIEFITETVFGSNRPFDMTVEAQIDTPLGDALQEVYLVDKKAFTKADYSDKPTAVKVPSTSGDSYNPSEMLAWIERLRSGDLGNVYYRRFTRDGGFTFTDGQAGGGLHYELSTMIPLYELPPDGFEPCLIAVTSNDAVQVYHFDYSGDKAAEQLVGIRMEGDTAKVLNNITLMANAQAAGGAVTEKLMDMASPTGSLLPLPQYEAAVSEEDGYLTYEYKLGIKLLQGKNNVSGADSAILSIAPTTIGIAVYGELGMTLDGESRELTDSYNVTVAAEELEALDYLPPLFAALPVKIEFDGNNPPKGSFTLTDSDVRGKDNTTESKTYSFSASAQVHVNAEVSAFKSLAVVPAVGPVLLSLEKSGALDMGAKVSVAAGADGTYKYTILQNQETEHEVDFTIGAGAGLGIYAKAFGGSVGAEANLKLSGDNDKLDDMVTVTAVIDKDGFQLKDISGKLTADAHIEIDTWFINGEKDFNFGEIPFKYEFNTETQFTLTQISVKSTMRSRNDFDTSTFNGKPETVVSNLLPIGGYAMDEDQDGTFLYTDMSVKGGDVRLMLAQYAGEKTWNTPVCVTSTDGLIPAFDVISLSGDRYLAVWTEIAKADMEKTCPPSEIKYAVGRVTDGKWSGSVQTLASLSSEVASKLYLVSDTTGVSLVALRTAEGAMAEKLSISGYRYVNEEWSGPNYLAADQPLYDISACAAGGNVFVSYVNDDKKLHVLAWKDAVMEATFTVTGFETALAADATTAYLAGETEEGLVLYGWSGNSWTKRGILTDMVGTGNPAVTVSGGEVIASWTAGSDKDLYTASYSVSDGKTGAAAKVKSAAAGEYKDSEVYTADDELLIMTILDSSMDGLNVYQVDGYVSDTIELTDAQKPTAATGLTYSGQAQKLVSAPAEALPDGYQMQYAVGENAVTVPELGWSVLIPTQTNAGTYAVWYRVIGDEGQNATDANCIQVTIAKGEYTGTKTVSATVTGNQATENATVALPTLPEGAGYGTVTVSGDLISGQPAVDGTTLTYSTAAKEDGTTATITIAVPESLNYRAYDVVVTVVVNTAVAECKHEHTEVRDAKAATCTEQGYTGDKYCTDCGSLVEQGEIIPIDPDNHAYDAGVITTPPTVYEDGVKTYTCIRCQHTYTEAVPKLDEYQELIEDIADIVTEDGESEVEVDVQVETKADGSTQTIVNVAGEEVEKTEVKDGVTTVESLIWIGGLNSSYRYAGSAVKPDFFVYDGAKKLTEGTDYSVSYRDNTKVGTATVTVKFKGNYKTTDQRILTFAIRPAVLGEDVTVADVAVAANGKEQKPVPELILTAIGKKADKKNFVFAYADAAGNAVAGVQAAGTYTVTVTSLSENFTGEAVATVTVTENKQLMLGTAKVVWNTSKYTYTGGEIVPASGSYALTLGGATLAEGTDYEVKEILNNVDPGKATIVFTAVDGNEKGYAGSKTATFTIVKGRVLTTGDDFTYEYSESVPYMKGGAKPVLTVRDNDRKLTLGKDYTVSYSKNTAATGTAKTAVITVKGKGNYKGSVKLGFAIARQDIAELSANILAADKAESKKGYRNPTVTITDLDGKGLKAGKDFRIGTDYTEPDADGSVTVSIEGIGNYAGTVPVTYRYIKAAQQINKLKANKLSAKAYTGRAVTLTQADLTGILYTGSKKSPVYLKPGEDFEVATYTNNVKTGTAKVTLRGIGAYGGTKTLTFKIMTKKGSYKGALVDGTWK